MRKGAERGERGPHLVLIGLMGAGKTTVGQRCARRLGRPFVDTDDLVATRAGMPISNVFATAGEGRFRQLERRAVADACAAPEPVVIACGGGAVLDPDNRRRLRAAGIVVWLTAIPDVLARRVQADGTHRPLLAESGAVATLERLAVVRGDAYAATAHVEIDTAGRTVDEVADAVLTTYRT
jgi:shikimate kinase